MKEFVSIVLKAICNESGIQQIWNYCEINFKILENMHVHMFYQ